MLTRIGKKSAPRDDDLVALLGDCHARIRSFVALGRALASADAAEAAEVAASAAAVARYFELALPLHAEDEDASLAPRLRGRDAELDAALDAMGTEHREHAPRVTRLCELCRAIEREPASRATLAPELAALVDSLGRDFEAHLEREERVVFPAIDARLDAAVRGAIVGELRARRAR
ncbi:MAG: hemerythrin domain-containing protein [Polyangiaceae bacterium]|nr:hemerythrin domain-containing protein [Polyangiaceae bacterium]